MTRTEILEALTLLKEQARNSGVNSFIWNVSQESFNFVIDSAIKELGQEPKTGEWIEHFDEIGKWYECDQCHTDWGGAVNYCPNKTVRRKLKDELRKGEWHDK